MKKCVILIALAFTMVGCSDGPKLASVSGVVTLDGKPYDKAVVSFQPISTKENQYPGRGSSAYTDENGRFVLTCEGSDGAVIGPHRVRIMTKGNNVVGQEGVGSDDGAPAPNLDPIPAEWNSKSEKEFVVPPSGTKEANFDIVTGNAASKKK